MKKIKQSQERMSKYYNLRNARIKFKVGDKVLKKNMKDTSRLEKLRKKYVGPYMIRDIAPSGNYYLTDRFSHDLKKPVPPNHLIHSTEKVISGIVIRTCLQVIWKKKQLFI